MNNSILLRSDTTFEPHLYALQDLPFVVRQNTHYTAGRIGRSNLHRNIEILRFCQGEGIVLRGENAYTVSAGDVVIINSYLAHRVEATTDLTFHCLIIGSEFSGENGIDTATYQFTPKLADPAVLSLFDSVIQAYGQQDSLWQARVRSRVLALLLHLCETQACPRTTSVAEDHAFQSIIASIGYMRENLQHKLTVEQVAEFAGFSKYYFLRLFKRITGCTVVQYINLLRCEHAKELLRTGHHTVKETALLCGFDNLSYFTSVFKKNTGYLPNAYKRKNKK